MSPKKKQSALAYGEVEEKQPPVRNHRCVEAKREESYEAASALKSELENTGDFSKVRVVRKGKRTTNKNEYFVVRAFKPFKESPKEEKKEEAPQKKKQAPQRKDRKAKKKAGKRS